MLGLSAALLGRWVERVGPRKTMVASAAASAAACWSRAWASGGTASGSSTWAMVHRGHRPGAGVHRAGLDAGEVVPRPAGDGDRPGDHGLRRRCAGRRAAGRRADGPLPSRDVGRRRRGVPGDGGRLLRAHDASARSIVRVPPADWRPEGYTPPAAAESSSRTPTSPWTPPGRRRSSGCSGRCSA